MNIDQLKSVLNATVQTNAKLVFCAFGHRGIGKTQTVKDVAKEKNLHLSILRIGSLQDVGDLLGMPEIKDGKTSYGEPLWFEQIKEGGILFLDEINRCKPSLMDAVMQIIDERKLYSWVLPDTVTIVASANPDTGEYDVQSMDSAMIDRLVPIRVEATQEDILKYISEHGFLETTIDLCSVLQPTSPEFKLPTRDYSISPGRSLRQLNEVLKLEPLIHKQIFDELVLGILGPKGFTEFKNREQLKQIPDPAKAQPEDVEKLDWVGKRVFVGRLYAWASSNKRMTKDHKKRITSLFPVLGEQLFAFFLRMGGSQYIDETDEKIQAWAKEVTDVLSAK